MPEEPLHKQQSTPTSEDKTGRDRLARNVVVSWISQLVFVAFGFILPRLISDSLGQVSLGIWDFSWAFVSYLNLAMLGIGSAVNRFVAVHRAKNDNKKLNGIVSSVLIIQLGISTSIAAIVLCLYHWIPIWFADRLGADVGDAQYVTLLLGFSVAIKMALDSYRGVITGCHRWDIHNLINSSQYLVSALLMIMVLVSGYGLRALAQVYLVVLASFEVFAMFVAHKLCPELSIRVSAVNLKDMKEITVFGVQKFVIGIGETVLIQTINVLIVAKLGPGALAVFARPIALLRHIRLFGAKFSHVMTPTVSSLQAIQTESEVKKFAINVSRVGCAIGLPPTMFFMIYGPEVIRIWMGESYVVSDVILILSISATLAVVYGPALSILVGLNRHGAAAKICVPVWILSVFIGITWANLSDWSLFEAALLLAISQLVVHLLIVPLFLAKALDMTWFEYLYVSYASVVAMNIACCVVLLILRELVEGSLATRLSAGLLVQSLIIVPLYWMFVVPDNVKYRFLRKLGIGGRAGA